MCTSTTWVAPWGGRDRRGLYRHQGHPLRRAGVAAARRNDPPGDPRVVAVGRPARAWRPCSRGRRGRGRRRSRPPAVHRDALLEAISACDAAEVVVLPNDGDSVRVAEIAARTATEDHGIRVAVIPAVTQVQGLAALAVHEPGRSFDKDVLEMTATARHVRHGAVTVAARQAMTMAGPCEPGDVLGVVDGDFAVVGAELGEVARQVVARLVGAGGELVTLVAGVDAGAMALAEGCAAWLGEQHPHVDVVVYDGGQERYPLLVSVE
ncbi:MAG: hypothetical protein R2734_12665 [Nocardioides sp.]